MKNDRLFLEPKVSEGYMSYTHELVTTFEAKWSWEHDVKADIFYVQYRKKNILGIEKIKVREYKFTRQHSTRVDSKTFRMQHIWDASEAAKSFIRAITELEEIACENDALLVKIDELEKEYIEGDDDFSSGVIFAIGKIKEVLEDEEAIQIS